MKEKVFKFFLSKRIVIFLLIANVTFLAQGAKYYAYQTGDWSSVATWTLDASGTTHIGSTIPGDNDEVFILSNKKVTLSADVSTEGLKISIDAGGILDLATYKFTNSLETLKGVGTLQLASTDFPTILGDDSFIKSGGGTTEYKNGSDFTFVQTEYNNLTISINSSATAMQLDDLQINGKLHIKSGTYQISDNSTLKANADLKRYELVVGGDVEVDAGANIKVGTRRTTLTEEPASIENIDDNPYVAYYKNHSHIVRIGGSLTNNGTVRFTNMPYPIYNKFPKASNETGFATVYFQGATNNTITANGTTDFYNLVVDKGNNQTYKLTLYSSNYYNFRLFGANTEGGINNGEANPIIRKALWLRNGTFELTGQVVIPSLTEGGGEPVGKTHFVIPQNAALVLNGPDVIVMVTADDYRELNVAYGVSTTKNSDARINNTAVDAGILVHGKLQVIDGYLSTRESSGILYPKNACVGEVVINGGKVEAKQFAPFDESEGLVSYTQTGGIFELRGR